MMAETQHFCLRWNNYQSSITSAFENLRDDEDFVDVTLACDGKSLKAHRVVLSACSPYFRELLKSTPCKHPVIVLQDVAFADLHALVEFIYHGEVNVHQRNLTSFLKTAEVLRVSGLTQQVDDRDEIPVPPHGILPRNTLQRSLMDDALFSSPQSPPIHSTPPGATVNQLLRRAAALAGGGNFHRRERRISPEHHMDSSAEQNKRARTSESTESTSSSALPAPTDFSASSFPSNKPLHQPSVKQESEGNNGERESSPSPNDRGVLDGVKTEPVDRCGSGGDMENSTDSVEATDEVRHSQAEQEDHDSVQGQPPPYLSPAESKLFGSITSSGTFNFSMAALAAEPFTGLANQALLGNSDISAGTSSQGLVAGDEFRCEPCGKILTSLQRLRRHIQNVHSHPSKIPICNICNKVYSTLNSLRNHKSIYHRVRKQSEILGLGSSEDGS